MVTSGQAAEGHRHLPAELLEHIRYLTPPEVATAQQVCREWWQAAEGSPRMRAAREAWLAPPTEVSASGTQLWKNAAGKLHRDGGRPAVVWADGSLKWYEQGQPHREGGRPAAIGADGSQWWYERGQLHREGGQPAVIKAGGAQEWWEWGRLHRGGGQPAIIMANGTRTYWVRGWPLPAPCS